MGDSESAGDDGRQDGSDDPDAELRRAETERLRAEVARLRAEVARLRAEVARLRAEVARLRQGRAERECLQRRARPSGPPPLGCLTGVISLGLLLLLLGPHS